MKKYELTSEMKNHIGHKLYRIKALKDFGSVKAGDLGGWIEKEENLSQDNIAWVFDEAKVYGNANVSDCAEVHDNAWIYCNANVCRNAKISNNVNIYGDAYISGNACISDDAEIYGHVTVYDNVRVFENAELWGYARICDRATIHGYAKVCDDVQIYGEVDIYGRAKISGNTFVGEKAEICGINICGKIDICGDAKVFSERDYIVFKNFWSSGRYFTWTKSNNMWKVGCFYGTGEELIKKAYADSEKSGKEYKRVVRYVESILADESKENE